ncbi:MAG: peptide chain release factor N(5)-glutamine methyltransferase [Alphaproteobacteria bacterium]|nr:peptide chain release factor N(5)-glutamine methyltransferase [Alphaproteobacteria bacterium]MBV8547878.1 peptide chain release factor N(5)-glutamine methyltransferase [Alphaproteobacteria bacterium]
MPGPVTLTDYQKQSHQRLRDAGIDNPVLDTTLIICHTLNLTRTALLDTIQRILTDAELDTLNRLFARRCMHESVSRIIGARPFWTLQFGLNEATLEPRPDSETLVEVTVASLPDKQVPFSILDLGTGTGCLLLSLLSELPNAHGLGIDKAPRAAEQATANAALNHLSARATFQTGDWLQGITERFDIIISNPPYIARDDIPTLMPEVRDYDPRLALDGGPDGLDIYRHLIPQLPQHLNKGGLAVFEVGVGQAEDVEKLMHSNGFCDVLTHMDLSGIVRCVIGFLA